MTKNLHNRCRQSEIGNGDRQDQRVRIVEYQPSFKRLNEKWITRWFKMETADYKSLDRPQEYLLDPGGLVS